MKIPDIYLAPVQFKDGDATRDFAVYTAKLTDLLRDIYENLHTLPVVTSTPAATEMEEIGQGSVKKSDVKIVHDATQTNRKVAYKNNGTVFVVDSA
mgnify:CR=1 FL=1